VPQQALPEQVPPEQQACPTPPQSAQTPLLQMTLPAVQLPLQQGWPAAPQVPQAPAVVALQVPPRLPQVLPDATQVPRTQQPAAEQTLLSQQIWPVPPQEIPDLVVEPPQPAGSRTRAAAKSSPARWTTRPERVWFMASLLASSIRLRGTAVGDRDYAVAVTAEVRRRAAARSAAAQIVAWRPATLAPEKRAPRSATSS
jgi:hypothetical protein